MCPVFEVSFKDVDNRFLRERLTADSVKAARVVLRERGSMPLEIKEISKLSLAFEGLREAIKKAGVSEDSEKRKAAREARKAEVAAIRASMGRLEYFNYEAVRMESHEDVIGVVRAANEREARAKLREMRLIPKELKRDWLGRFRPEVDETPRLKTERQFDQSEFERLFEKVFPPKVSSKELSLMANQMASIAQAGLPIVEALHLLQDTVSNKYLKRVIKDMVTKVSEGQLFGQAVAEHPDVFPPIFIELINMGELTGNLDENVKRLAEYLQKQQELQQKIKGAMTYPVIVLGILVLIVVGLMIFIVPTFMKLFTEFKVTLPLATRVLLTLSWLVTDRWYFIFALPVLMWLRQQVVRTAFFKFVWDKIEFKIPIYGKLNYKVTLTHMLNNLAMALRSGVTVIKALDSLQYNTKNHLLKEKVIEISESVKMGARLGVVVLAADLFPSIVNRLISVGDETGAMDEMLSKAAAYMDTEVEQAVKTLTSAIEPIMTLFLGGTVMFIVGSLYFPLMGIMSGGGAAK